MFSININKKVECITFKQVEENFLFLLSGKQGGKSTVSGNCEITAEIWFNSSG